MCRKELDLHKNLKKKVKKKVKKKQAERPNDAEYYFLMNEDVLH